ncbi:carbohydrate ABC transporter permease [Geitlerinema splendidum]|jgi:multiple sugar transport system permease protein|nr:carbohydrate ABC transporter permease [Geitlerinema splendidum]
MDTRAENSFSRAAVLSKPYGISRSRRFFRMVFFYTVMITGAIIICLPLFWMVSSSLKAPNRLFTIPIEWIPYDFRWENYIEAWNTAPFGRYFFNSIFVSVSTTLLNLFFCSLAGFAFAKYRFPGRNILFLFILATMMIPFHVVVVPLFTLMRDLRWLNSYAALIVPGAMSAFGIFLMRQFILTLPDELFDAARIDGASEFGIYLRVVLPLSTGPLAALAVFVFLDNWNSLLWPLVTTTRDEWRTVAVGLTQFQTVHGTKYHLMMAASTLVVIPMLIVFFLLQRHFIRGVALSGLKG